MQSVFLQLIYQLLLSELLLYQVFLLFLYFSVETLQSNYKEFIDFLYQDNNVILFPTISYRDPNDDACNIEGNCTEMYTILCNMIS